MRSWVARTVRVGIVIAVCILIQVVQVTVGNTEGEGVRDILEVGIKGVLVVLRGLGGG